MNRMIWPSMSLISLRTALSRSSNSPRNLAPAMSAPRSSAMTRLSLRPSGTSPRTIRWARPSTMAVLPTPGSPISTGLFFVRRERTWMTRRISSSRPMTGSSLPARASAVRSRPYFSSAWYVPSGFGEVTRWPPRTPWSALRIASRPAPCRSRSDWPSPPTSAAPSRRCSVETYSSPRRRASSSALSMTWFARGSRLSEPPSIRARRAEDRGELARGRPGDRRRAAGASRPGRRRPARRARTGCAPRREWGYGGSPRASGRRGRLLGLLGELDPVALVVLKGRSAWRGSVGAPELYTCHAC